MNTFKEMQDALMSYSTAIAIQTVEFGQEMWKHQIKFAKDVSALVPNFDKLMNTKKD